MKYEPVKMHYAHFMHKFFTFCGFLVAQIQNMTTNPDEVTCKRCLKSMKIYAWEVTFMKEKRNGHVVLKRQNG